MKNTPQARYRATKVKTRCVDFYPNDIELLNFSRQINFAAFVKEKLNEALKEKKDNEKTYLPNP